MLSLFETETSYFLENLAHLYGEGWTEVKYSFLIIWFAIIILNYYINNKNHIIITGFLDAYLGWTLNLNFWP